MTVHSITTAAFPDLHYARYGNGPAIVLLHGFPATSALWDAVIPALSKHFTLLIPDMPGTGSSRLEGERTTIGELATGIKSLLEDTGLEKAIVAGHSMGGYVALAFAKRHPQYVAGLALIHSTAAADDDEKKAARQKAIALIRKGGKSAFVQNFVPTLFGTAFQETQPEIITAQARVSAAMPDATMIAFYTAMMERTDSREALSGVAFPVQWIIGGEDTVIPPQKVMQQTYLTDVSFISIYAGAGHMSMVECPERLAADLNTFAGYCFRKEITTEKQG